MTLLLGALTIGLILSLLALGIYISYRVFDIADITADGSITLGASICAVLIVREVNPLLATLAGFGGGLAAGTVTGILQARFRINALLSGILVMTGLYWLMVRNNLSIYVVITLFGLFVAVAMTLVKRRHEANQRDRDDVAHLDNSSSH